MIFRNKIHPLPHFPPTFLFEKWEGGGVLETIFWGLGPRYSLLVYQIRAQKQGTSCFSVISWDII